MEKKMNQRALEILKNLIEHYIREGNPVGSKTLAEDSRLMVSSATIRNIMKELETAGYLTSPHTSSGRIPTAQGYRLFVDHFTTIQEPAEQEVNRLRKQLDAGQDTQSLVVHASSLLSGITKLAGIVTLPKHGKLILRQVEFLPLSNKRVLVILVLNDHDVQNRVMYTDRKYKRSELEQAGNYLTQHFAGKDLLAARDDLLMVMQEAHKDLVVMIKAVMQMAEQNDTAQNNEDYVLMGEANLLNAVDVGDYQKLHSLFEAFSQKRDILHLLDQCLQAKGLQIFIGEEAGYAVFDNYSMVTAPYKIKDKIVGVLGVIGPTRIPYHRVISAVDITAKLLSQAFSGGEKD